MARKHLGRHVRAGGGIDFSIDGEHPVRRSFQGGPVEDRDHGFRALAVVDGPIGSEGALEAVGAPQQREIDRGLAWVSSTGVRVDPISGDVIES